MLVLYFMTDQGSEREVGHFVMGAVLGLRIVVPDSLRRPFGRLLRQRQYSSSQTFQRPGGQLLWQRQSCVVAASQCVCSCGADKLTHRS